MAIALRALAARLDQLAEARARAARDVRIEWSGPLRDRFDAERARRDAAAAHLVARCRSVAASLEAEHAVVITTAGAAAP